MDIAQQVEQQTAPHAVVVLAVMAVTAPTQPRPIQPRPTPYRGAVGIVAEGPVAV